MQGSTTAQLTCTGQLMNTLRFLLLLLPGLARLLRAAVGMKCIGLPTQTLAETPAERTWHTPTHLTTVVKIMMKVRQVGVVVMGFEACDC